MAKPGPAPKPALAVVREGNQGHHGRDRLEGGLRLEASPPPEPDWQQWWPAVRLPTKKQLQARYSTAVVEGQLAHIEDDNKRAHLAAARRAWLIDRDRRTAQRQQQINKRAREVARRTWRREVPILSRQGLLALVDETVLTDYCICVARLDECERNISELGIWQHGERGAMKNPATTVANQLRGQLRFYVQQLGLSPIARDAMQPREADDDDEGVFD